MFMKNVSTLELTLPFQVKMLKLFSNFNLILMCYTPILRGFQWDKLNHKNCRYLMKIKYIFCGQPLLLSIFFLKQQSFVTEHFFYIWHRIYNRKHFWNFYNFKIFLKWSGLSKRYGYKLEHQLKFHKNSLKQLWFSCLICSFLFQRR